MAKRSNSNRTANRSNRRRLDSNDDNKHSWGLWAELPDDILLTILMMLGVIHYIKFSGVCKSWRSFALSHREDIFSKKEPLMITLLKQRKSPKRTCFVDDIFGKDRRYETTLPSTSRGTLLGVSCGYLILLTRTYKFSLVNLMTRHQLSFPVLPNTPFSFSGLYRAILVYSSLLSKYIIVVYSAEDNRLLFCEPGASQWVVIPSPDNNWDIIDLKFFKGKIYMLNYDGKIGEIRIHPMNSVKYLDVKRVPYPKDFMGFYKWYSRQLVTSSKRLFMVDRSYSRRTVNYELDFEKMEWVVREDLGEDTIFYSDNCTAAVTATNPQRRGRAYSISPYFRDLNDSYAWYFPHECYARNILNDS